MPKFSTEMFFRVYNDKTGDYVEIRPDADALGLIDISSIAFHAPGRAEKEGSITIYPEAALMLAACLKNLAETMLKDKI